MFGLHHNSPELDESGAHLRKAHHGSDEWRNGLPFCSTHHDAFDAHLFTINPETLAIETMPSVSPSPDSALPRSPFFSCVAPGAAPDKVFPPPMQTIAASICLSAAAT